MDTRETSVWHTIQQAYRPWFIMKRITDRLQGGIADVAWKAKDGPEAGWWEIKVDSPDTDWVRSDQALFLREWASCPGGLAGVLARSPGKLWTYYPAGQTYDWVKLMVHAPERCRRFSAERLPDLLFHILGRTSCIQG